MCCCHVLPQDMRTICRSPAGLTLPGWAETQFRAASYEVFLSFLSYTGMGRDSLNNIAISPLKASAILLIMSYILKFIPAMQCR